MNENVKIGFDINISTKNYNTSEHTKEYVDKKLSRLIKFNGEIQFMDLRIEKDSHEHYEVTLKMGIPNKNIPAIKENDKSLHACIDNLYDKGERILTHLKH